MLVQCIEFADDSSLAIKSLVVRLVEMADARCICSLVKRILAWWYRYAGWSGIAPVQNLQQCFAGVILDTKCS